jgi:hypothetical protein
MTSLEKEMVATIKRLEELINKIRSSSPNSLNHQWVEEALASISPAIKKHY